MSDISRRTFIRGAGAATGAVIVGGGSASLDRGPVQESEAIAPLVAGAAVAGGYAIAYLMNEAADKYLGDTRDYSGYTGENALHQEIKAGSLQMKSADERVLTSLQNNLTNADNVALTKGKAAVIKKMNNEVSESEAQTAMQEAIDSYFTTIQKNLITHYKSQFNQTWHFRQQYQGNSNVSSEQFGDTMRLSALDELSQDQPAGTPYSYRDTSKQTSTVTFLNGESFDYPHTSTYTAGNGSEHQLDPWSNRLAPLWLSGSLGSNSNWIKLLDPKPFKDIWDTIVSRRDNVNANLSGFVTDVYSQYAPGDIPTEDLVDPITAATELSQNYEGYQFRGAQAAMLGIPTSSNTGVTMTIEYQEGDSQVLADMFTEYQPTDGSGNPTDFRKGTTYDPSTWDKPLYISYEYTDSDGNQSSDFIQLETPFTIDKITKDDGTEINNFRPESRNNQTADVTKLEEELAQVRQAQIDMQNEAEEETSGGAGGLFSGNSLFGLDLKYLLIGGGAIALVFNQYSN